MNKATKELLHSYLIAARAVLDGYRGFGWSFGVVTLLFLAVGALAAVPPYFIKLAANELGLAEKNTTVALAAVAAFAVAWTLANVLENAKGAFSAAVLCRADAALHAQALKSLLLKPYRELAESSPGKVWPEIAQGIQGFSSTTVSLFWIILPFFFEICTTAAILATAASMEFAGLFFLAVITLSYVSYEVARRSAGIHARLYKAENALQEDFVERYSFLYDIKINNSNAKETAKHAANLKNYVATITAVNRAMALRLGLQAAGFGLTLLIFSLLAAYMAQTAGWKGGEFVMVATYVGSLTAKLRLLAAALIDLQRSIVALDIGVQYFQPVSKEKVSPGLISGADLFTFNHAPIGSELGNERLDVALSSGKFYAIVGPSGVGKSTLINQLIGILPVSASAAHFMGQSLDAMTASDILEHVAVAPQNPKIFKGTLKENLLYASGHVDAGLLDKVVEALELHRIFGSQHLNPLEIELGIQGHELSGGERARVSIARALLRRKNILILDEPTAALDATLGAKVIDFARKHCETLIVVTHDEAIINKADHVVSLQADAQARRLA